VCDLLCALPSATEGVALFAKNSDRPAGEGQVVEWLAPRLDHDVTAATHVMLPAHPAPTFGIVGSRLTWGWGLEHGVNEAGLAVGNASVFTTLDPRPAPDALTGMDLVRLLLERAPDADTAVSLLAELLAEVGQGGSGHDGPRRPYWSSFLVVDPARAYVVETSGSGGAVEEVHDVRAISNRTTIPGFTAEVAHPGQPVATLVQPRLDASAAVLARRPVTVAALEEHLRSHVGGADGWTICMHAPGADDSTDGSTADFGRNEGRSDARVDGERTDETGHAPGQVTTSSMVAELPAGEPPLVHALLGAPCQGTYVEIEVSSALGLRDRRLMG
jgi:hypothetical protein